jgi:hypothetical protein
MMQFLLQELKCLATPVAKSLKSAATNPKSKMQPPLDRRDAWIMLCMDHKHPPLTTLHQIQLSAKPSNTELFQRLATEYKNKREPYTLLTIKIRPFWRKVKAVHFVRFMTLSPQPRLTAQIEEMPSTLP